MSRAIKGACISAYGLQALLYYLFAYLRFQSSDTADLCGFYCNTSCSRGIYRIDFIDTGMAVGSGYGNISKAVFRIWCIAESGNLVGSKGAMRQHYGGQYYE